MADTPHVELFVGPPEIHSYSALLFDLDGTLIDSINAIVHHWTDVGRDIGVDPQVILATSHGRRSIDVLKQLSPDKANWDYVKRMEGQVPKLYCSDAVEIKGARRLLASLQSLGAPWAIVTSGTSDLASGWLAVLGLPQPSALVTAEAVASGKPDPEGYLAARAQVLRGRELRGERRALVLEDAPAGIAAGVAAGCDVVALATSHGVAELRDTRARWVVRDLESVRVVGYDAESGDVQVEVRNWIERREAN